MLCTDLLSYLTTFLLDAAELKPYQPAERYTHARTHPPILSTAHPFTHSLSYLNSCSKWAQ